MIHELSDFSHGWYSKYLLSSSPTFKIENYDSILIHPSKFAKENLYYITQAININAKLPFHYKLNKFSSYCVLYTSNAHCKLFYKNNTYIIKPNTVFFIDCNFPHSIELYDLEESHLQLIYLNGNSISYFYKIFSENNCFACNLQISSDIPFTLKELFKQCKQDSKYSEFIISSLITSLLTNLLLSKEYNINNTCSAPKYILDIKTLLDYNYTHSYSLNELAKKCNVNKYKLVRDFTNYLSISPINYLISRRIEIAKKLLRTTTLSVHEISYSVGIENTNHFINLFRKNTNITPLNYRKLHDSHVSNYLK